MMKCQIKNCDKEDKTLFKFKGKQICVECYRELTSPSIKMSNSKKSGLKHGNSRKENKLIYFTIIIMIAEIVWAGILLYKG